MDVDPDRELLQLESFRFHFRSVMLSPSCATQTVIAERVCECTNNTIPVKGVCELHRGSEETEKYDRMDDRMNGREGEGRKSGRILDAKR